MLVVKALLIVTSPACSAFVLAQVVFGPLPNALLIAFALALPAGSWAFYKLIKRAVIKEIERRLEAIDETEHLEQPALHTYYATR